MYSFFLCERDESPGPIFTASQLIRIQSEVVGEENVSIPSCSATAINFDASCVALEQLLRFLGISLLLQMP